MPGAVVCSRSRKASKLAVVENGWIGRSVGRAFVVMVDGSS